MKYNISNITRVSCVITLIPEVTIEEKLLEQAQEEDTFLYHYQFALNKFINKDATFIKILDFSRYPKLSWLNFKIQKGLELRDT